MAQTQSDPHFLGAYQRYAKMYNFYFGKLMNPGRIKAIEVAGLKPGERVLEVGVGTGLSLPFYPNTVEVTGIDLSSKMLEQARKLALEDGLTHVKGLFEMNAESLDFPDNTFDCVMGMHVSTVVGDPAQFARELRRVCKPQGRIILVNYFYEPEKPIGRVSRLLAPVARFLGWRPDLTLNEFLQKTGFQVDQMVPVNLLHIHNVLLIKNDSSASASLG